MHTHPSQTLHSVLLPSPGLCLAPIRNPIKTAASSLSGAPPRSEETISAGGKQARTHTGLRPYKFTVPIGLAHLVLLKKSEPDYSLALSSPYPTLQHQPRNKPTHPQTATTLLPHHLSSPKPPPNTLMGVYIPHLGWAGLDPAAARMLFSSLPQQQFNPLGAVGICQQCKSLHLFWIHPLSTTFKKALNNSKNT